MAVKPLEATSSKPQEERPSFSLSNRIERALWILTWGLLASWTPPPLRSWPSWPCVSPCWPSDTASWLSVLAPAPTGTRWAVCPRLSIHAPLGARAREPLRS